MGRAGKGRKRSSDTKKRMSESLKAAHQRKPGAWRKDYTVSEETKQKISAAHIGRKLTTEWIKNRTSSQKGLKRSEETRKRMGEVRMGPKSTFWRGGVSKKNMTARKIHMATFEYRQWRRLVFERDDYTCQFCCERGGKLHADHIKPYAKYPKLRTTVANGRTLCESCHKTTPTWGGRCYN